MHFLITLVFMNIFGQTFHHMTKTRCSWHVPKFIYARLSFL